MRSLSVFGRFLERRAQQQGQDATRRAMANLSDADLADMGAKRFHQVQIPESVETVILLADNDPEGRRAQRRALEAYARPGLTLETEWPPGRMNDWAQLLKR